MVQRCIINIHHGPPMHICIEGSKCVPFPIEDIASTLTAESSSSIRISFKHNHRSPVQNMYVYYGSERVNNN